MERGAVTAHNNTKAINRSALEGTGANRRSIEGIGGAERKGKVARSDKLAGLNASTGTFAVDGKIFHMVCDNRCHTGAKHCESAAGNTAAKGNNFLGTDADLVRVCLLSRILPVVRGGSLLRSASRQRERHRNRQDQCKNSLGFHFVSSKNFIVLSEGA